MADDFRTQQFAFAAHLRNPDVNPAPGGIEDRRLKIYRELFFNNLRSLLASTFPVLHRVLGDARWAELVRRFFHRHVSHTPLFTEVPREFVAWLDEAFENTGDWPLFMTELAHYEWVELDVSIDPAEIDDAEANAGGNILEGRPVLSPVARPLAYRWPVHRIGPSFQPDAPGEQPTFLVVWRKRDDEVGFIEVNAVTARLLDMLQQADNATGRELLERLAGEIGHADSAIVIESGTRILEDLCKQDIIVRTR